MLLLWLCVARAERGGGAAGAGGGDAHARVCAVADRREERRDRPSQRADEAAQVARSRQRRPGPHPAAGE